MKAQNILIYSQTTFLIFLQMCKQRTSGTKIDHILYLKGFLYLLR